MFLNRANIELITLLKNDTDGFASIVTVIQSGEDSVGAANAGSARVDARIIARIIDKIFFI